MFKKRKNAMQNQQRMDMMGMNGVSNMLQAQNSQGQGKRRDMHMMSMDDVSKMIQERNKQNGGGIEQPSKYYQNMQGFLTIKKALLYLRTDDYTLDLLVALGYVHFKYNSTDGQWYCPIKELDRVLDLLHCGMLML